MKRITFLKYIFLPFLVLASLYFLTASYTCTEKKPAGRDQLLGQTMIGVLNQGHFQPQQLDDDFSKKVFKLYIERIDFNKRFLIKEDVDALKKFEDKIDDEIRTGNYDFLRLSNEIIEKRIKENEGYYKEMLSQPMEFTKDESVELDPDKMSWPSNKNEAKEMWRKYLKYQVMVRLADMMETQQRAKEKKDTVVEMKTPEQMESDSRKQVMKSYDELFKRYHQLTDEDRLSSFMNCVANSYDPHTEYFPPKEKQNFDITMSGRLEGIGATLQEKDDYIRVSAIVPGSPSWKQGQLKPGDIILKVAQGSSEPVDVVGMRLDNAVEMIRGKKGTEVRLTVKKADGSIIVVPIIRDVVVIEETYAQSAIVKSKKKMGYIKLPGFYADFSKSGGRNSSTDIKKELIKLKSEKVEGIILDLRDNGGGSLQDVVDMMGYFIDKGPIVQVKTKVGAPNVFNDRDESVIWDGPLVVMVNNNSASASEILAAAVQDYKRGAVIGMPTFGKGTVQRFIELDEYIQPGATDKPLGSLKLTTEKFYRINGNSTQLKGVTPDIVFPDPYAYIEKGEKEQDFPLPFDEIAPAKYNTWKSMNLDKAKKNSSARTQESPAFKLVADAAKMMEERSKRTETTLNITKFMEEQKKLKEEAKKLELPDKETGIEVISLKVDLDAAAGDTSKAARTADWFKKLKRDIYLQEAISIAGDLKE
jgi:carboxyl-terminal processing protease